VAINRGHGHHLATCPLPGGANPTSLGRVLLSGLSHGELDGYFRAARLERYTELTETDPRRLRALINDAGKSGYVASWLPSP
jgi:DNA-binding IclR family transcriptional regulator